MKDFTVTITQQGEPPITLHYLAPPPAQGPFTITDPSDPRLGVPVDANLVPWHDGWTYLHEAFAALGNNDILLLPERPEPYLLDASQGFLASGVREISDHGPIVQGPMWFALARSKRGILGLGPGARIEIAEDNRILGPQFDDSQGGAGGRIVTYTNGTKKELIGCAEKMIECTTPKSYFGNFTLTARDLGGVAYHMIAISPAGKDSLVERVALQGAQGFSAVPNGESGAVSSSADRTTIRKLEINDSGSSPIMINSCTGTLIEDVTLRRAQTGMLTIWNGHGTHTLRRVIVEYGAGGGLNIEKPQASFNLTWDQGTILVDKPSGGYYATHLKIGNGTTSIKATLTGIQHDKGPWPGSFSIQLYGSPSGVQRASDVTVTDAAGMPIPVRFAGAVKAT